MTDIGRLKRLMENAKRTWSEDESATAYDAAWRDYKAALLDCAPHLLSEIETLRARLAAAERVVEAARTHIMLEWGTLDAAMLGAKRYREGWGAVPDSEIALIESLAAYDQGKVTI